MALPLLKVRIFSWNYLLKHKNAVCDGISTAITNSGFMKLLGETGFLGVAFTV